MEEMQKKITALEQKLKRQQISINLLVMAEVIGLLVLFIIRYINHVAIGKVSQSLSVFGLQLEEILHLFQIWQK